MGRGILRGLEHLAHVALAHLVGLPQHPDLLERRWVLAQEDLPDEGLADGPRLAQHPHLLTELHVLAAEDLIGERAADLTGLGEHPPLLRLAGGEGGGSGHRPGRDEDRAFGLRGHQAPGLVTIRKIARSTSALPISVTVRTWRNSASYSSPNRTAPSAGAAAMSRSARSASRASRGLKYAPPLASRTMRISRVMP